MRFLDLPPDDPWTRTASTLTIASPDTPTAHGSRDTGDGRIDVQRYGDGRSAPFQVVVRFFPDDDSAPRYPTLDELLEVADRFFPVGYMVGLPGVMAGPHGLFRPRVPGGEPLTLMGLGFPEGVRAPAGVIHGA